MATGANLQQGRGIQVSNLPARSDVSEGAGQVFDALGNVGDKIRAGAKPALAAKARQLGAREGMDAAAGGEVRSRTFDFGEIAAQREAAYGQAYLAGTSNDFDAQEADVRRRNQANPEGYEAEMQAVRSGFIQGADPAYAVDVEQYAIRRGQAGLSAVADQAAQVQITEANNALTARMGGLEGRALGLIDEGNERTIEFEIIKDEYEQLIETRVANPQIPYSREEADADLREFQVRGQSRVVARQVREVLESEGSIAALDFVNELQADPDLDPAARPAIVQAAREAAHAGIAAMQQRVNIANTERNQREAELARLVDEDVAGITLSGEGTGLTEEQVRSIGGNDAVVDWLKKRADAHEFNNLVGNLPLNDPDAAAAQIRAASDRQTQNFSTGFGPVADDSDLATLATAIVQVESRGVNGLVSADPDGAGGGAGGAFGLMQVLPATAETIARGLGIRFDASNAQDRQRLRTDAAFNQQIGRAYLGQLIERYNGDSFLAVTAYHAGEGNVDGWLRSVGDPRSGQISREDWLTGVEGRGNPLSAAYPRKVLAAMQAGRQGAAWEQYSANRQAAQADPASYVQRDFAVRAAREAYQAAPNSVTAVENYIGANIAAQDRTSIREGDRTTLPGQSLAIWAGDLERYARAGDTAGFQALSEEIVRRHGRYGERVLQDVLETRGDTRWAAMVSARASTASAAGQRQPPAAAANAQSAVRAEQISRTAGGTQRGAEAMSTEELRAAAGL